MPEFLWHLWKFQNPPRTLWTSIKNQKQYLNWLGEKLGFDNLDNYYHLKKADLSKNYGSSLLQQYRSPSELLTTVYQDHHWLKSKFSIAGFWREKKNHRDHFYQILELKEKITPQDLYDITMKEFRDTGASSLLSNYYLNSPRKAIMNSFPEHAWNLFSFKSLPFDSWRSKKMWENFFKKVEHQLGVKELEDWYRVSWDQLRTIQNTLFLKNVNSLFQALKFFYPSHNWKPELFRATGSKKSSQRSIFVWARKIFGLDVVEDYHTEMIQSKAEKMLELDVFVRNYALGFEYQGMQHYETVKCWSASNLYEWRDDEKYRACKELGITLLYIPYFLKEGEKSFLSIIEQYRPDVT